MTPPMHLSAVAALDTAGRAVLELADAIRRADMQPGDQFAALPELAASLGIARGNVRRALAVLADAGVVEIRVGRGGGTWMRDRKGIVAALSAVLEAPVPGETLTDLLEFREVLQTTAALRIARKADPDVIRRLREGADLIASALENGDRATARHEATELHCAIALNCGNRGLGDALLRVIDQMSVIGYRAGGDTQQDALLVLCDELVRAIEAQDEEAIRATVAQQMRISFEIGIRFSTDSP
ncbi:FadR/GntR family transcriptional regulator [Nonomuraea sp. NPDC048826]|uniref:FadR/GntR family transcriptional regulator n=1 Tax=Nonomuraea sp. NPDC048826 TaxID=3364347 RepID=UPI003714F167